MIMKGAMGASCDQWDMFASCAVPAYVVPAYVGRVHVKYEAKSVSGKYGM